MTMAGYTLFLCVVGSAALAHGVLRVVDFIEGRGRR